MNSPLGSGGPEVPPKLWKAKVSRMYGKVTTTFYTDYLAGKPGAVAPTEGSYTSPYAGIVDGVDFASLAANCNPDGSVGVQTEWMVKLLQLGTSKYSVEGIILAQKREWDDLRTRQSANKAALEGLTATAGEPTTGETLTFGAEGMPLPPAGSNDTDPIIGPTLTFGAGGMPPDPEGTYSDPGPVLGTMLTGEGSWTDVTVAQVRKLRKTFNKRWKVQETTEGTTVRNVKTKDYVWVAAQRTLTYSLGQGALTSSITIPAEENGWTTEYTGRATVANLQAPITLTYGSPMVTETYAPPFYWAEVEVRTPLYTRDDGNGNVVTVVGHHVPGSWTNTFISASITMGEYHTQTVNNNQVTHVKTKDYAEQTVWYGFRLSSLQASELGISYNPNYVKAIGLSSDTATLIDHAFTALGSTLGSSTKDAGGGYTVEWSGPWSPLDAHGGYFTLNRTTYLNGVLVDGPSIGHCYFSNSSGIETAEILGEYHVETVVKSKLVLTEETGSYGVSEMIIQPRNIL